MEKGLVKHFDRSESLALPIKKKSYSQVIPFDQKGGGWTEIQRHRDTDTQTQKIILSK